jgi:hypothetical protein
MVELKSKILWRWYISTNIMFLDIIYRPVFIQKHLHVYITKHNVSENRVGLRLQVIWAQSMKLEIGTSSIDWAQLSKFYLKTEIDSSVRNVVFCNINRKVILDKDRTIDNVQEHNFCTDGWTDEQINGWMDILIVKWPSWWIDKWTKREEDKYHKRSHVWYTCDQQPDFSFQPCER